MRNKHGYTPKQAAYDIAIGWLKQAHEGVTADLQYYSRTPDGNASMVFDRELKKQIAKLHDRLLEQSGMDGMCISSDEGKDPRQLEITT